MFISPIYQQQQHLPLARFVCSDGRSVGLPVWPWMHFPSLPSPLILFLQSPLRAHWLVQSHSENHYHQRRRMQSCLGCWTNTNEAGAKSCCCQYTHRLAFGEAHIRGREQTLSPRVLTAPVWKNKPFLLYFHRYWELGLSSRKTCLLVAMSSPHCRVWPTAHNRRQ